MAFNYNDNSGTLASVTESAGVAAQTGDELPEILTEVCSQTEEHEGLFTDVSSNSVFNL